MERKTIQQKNVEAKHSNVSLILHLFDFQFMPPLIDWIAWSKFHQKLHWVLPLIL